jgi:hypothetical protein
MKEHALAIYLADCRARRATGAVTPETSLYAPLEALLNAAGATLKPAVRAFMSLRNRGGNMPDGGLFTPNQFDKEDTEAPAGQMPSRGVIECKKPKDELLAVAGSPQVARYWETYSQVLVTNYREFLLVGRDDAGKLVRYEHFQLAATEKDFWNQDAAQIVASLGDPFLDFLKRCLLRPAPITEPKDVAWFLASYARDAKARMERAGDVPALANVQKALEQALGLSFDTAKIEEGQRFFRSTLVQTLFYGVFSAWVLWHRGMPKPKERFDWEKAAKFLRVPVLRKLFHELAEPGKLEEWKLDEVLGWAGEVLNRVERPAFFSKFEDTHAVQYFYEPFLEQFDPELRKQLGVWYTPPEIVEYMVGRVDQILREDLDRPDGLADESVYVLDPCCGTGAYLVEVLRRIDATLKAEGNESTRAAKLKTAASERLFGFELLPAPFVVAHLQLGLEMQHAGAPFDDKSERPAIYLTNALTGWDPRIDATKSIFDEFNKEREAAEKVKRQKPILVILGNPPYNGFAGIAVKEERALTDNYRWKPGDPEDLKPQGQGLNDLYVRFFRMAERSILRELSGGQEAQGIVCFISNYSWLDGLSFPLMRQRYMNAFDSIWIDSLNGDKYKTGKLTPDGESDPSAFSTNQNREGIQVGTAIATMVRSAKHKSPAEIFYRDFWGLGKLKELLLFGRKWTKKRYARVEPIRTLGLPFRAMKTTVGYSEWPLLNQLFPSSFPGVQTKQDQLVVDIDKDRLRTRIGDFFDESITDSQLAKLHHASMDGHSGSDPVATRSKLKKRGIKNEYLVRLLYKPFDLRWIYWEPETTLLGRKSPELFRNIFQGNLMIEARRKEPLEEWKRGALSRILPDNFGNGFSNFFPMLLKEETNGHSLFGEDTGRKCHELGDYCANLSDKAVEYLQSRGQIKATPSLFFHTVAVLHAPIYATENNDALRQDWPRVPLPNDAKLLKGSGALGREIADLLDPEKPLLHVTTGMPRPQLRYIGVVRDVDRGQLDPNKHFAVTARWGIAGKGGICMPSTGRLVERDYTDDERDSLGEHIAQLGGRTFDIYLNEKAYWSNVPGRVWDYTLGGYQVLKKWLSYREFALLGRALRLDEVEYFTQVIRRIAALRMLGPALDANYAAVKADLFDWPR